MKSILTAIYLLFFSSALLADEHIYFPYQYTPEVLEKNWMKVRVEGQDSSYLKNPFRFVGYSIKAFKKKFSAPKEAVNYFSRHKDVLNSLALMPVDAASSEEVKVSSMSLVGDLMWLRTGWSGFLDSKIKKHFEERDFLFGNLETLISKSFKVPTFPPARATFNSPPSLIDEFKGRDGRSLFSALSVANNHALDYGETGLMDTLRVLEEREIPFSGLLDSRFTSSKKRWVMIEKKGLKVGFYAATYGMNNRWEEESDVDFNLLKKIAPHDPQAKVPLGEIKSVLEEMEKNSVDIKIVSLHWGFEYEYYPGPKQMIVARNIVKLGADIIMGHHSHSQQPLEVCFVSDKEVSKKDHESGCFLKGEGKRRKALIAYGLGNFLTNMYGFLSEVGTVLDLKLYLRKDGSWSWYAPQIRLVYNERDYENKNRRRLLFIDDFVKEKCFSRKCSRSQLEDLSFLKGLYPENVFRSSF